MKEEYKRILDKLANEEELSMDEQQLIDDFYSSFEHRSDVLDVMAVNNQDQIKRRLKEGIDRRIDQAEEPHRVNRTSALFLLKVASIVVVIISFSLFLYINQSDFEKAPSTEQFKIGSTYSSGAAVTQVRLPDGSLVFLNTNSSLEVDEAFGKKKRRVSIEGEAYFDIAKRDSEPFIVENNEAEIRVLGTTFWLNDRDYSNYITLVSGEVQFTAQSQTILMKPSQRLSRVAGESRFEVRPADMSPLRAWKTNPFLLQNISIEDFADFLMNRYSVDIRFSNEDIKKCFITISIDGSETYQELLTMAGIVNNFDFTEKNGAITISGEGCSSL